MGTLVIPVNTEGPPLHSNKGKYNTNLGMALA